ncbi:MAG TPA: ABC transporter permease [Thermoanaerobaculia bacterium]|nr:ABC transporter permease [Thermoanaerobaculia bacterium]
MHVLESFRIALSALRTNPLRAVLTTLGIVIAVAAVVAVVSIVQGLQFMIVGELQSVGANFIIVLPDMQQQQAPGVVARQIRLTWDDGQAIAREVPGVERITPMVLGKEEVRYRDRRYEPEWVMGVNDDFPEIHNYFVGEGRFFSEIDLRNRRRVVVVGQEVVDELRLGAEPVGREIYVGGRAATVIGVMEEKGQSLGQDFDSLVFVPYDTALTLFGRRAGDQVQLRLKAEPEAVAEVEDGIRRVLRRRHDIPEDDPNDFQILKQDDLLDLYRSILGAVTAVIGGVVGVALVVGGIGIMNIMLVSVTERTREIGLRKAVGARRRDILWQFLIEAVTLSLVGGAIGLAAGYGLGALVTSLLPIDLPPAYVPLWAILLAFGFSAAVGVFFGIYPAGKASRLDPIEALRYE